MRVLIVDDQEYMRRGFRALLSDHPDFQVVGEARDGTGAIDMVQKLRPDAVIMDVSMPVLDGLDATREIRHFFPRVQVVTVGQYEVADMQESSVNAGAVAHVAKTEVWDKLIPTLQKLPLQS